MEVVYQGENTYLSLKNKYGEIENVMVFILGRSGFGKGLASESLLEEFHNAGYLVISISDPKDELEMAYAMFEPEKRYHIENLNLVGKKKGTKKVKIYHPFTFKIPKKLLPQDINFYTISLKELGREEWSLIAETSWDTDTMKLLLDASQNINNDDGIYGLLHHIRDMVKGQKHEGGRRTKYDPKNFFLDVTSGTIKPLQDIANYIKPYKQDYFLAPNNSTTNINWKKILQDQEHYHVFVSNWIKDKKLKGLLILYLFQKIIENKQYRKGPVIIFIPDIKNICPFKPQGYELFLSQGIKEHLSTIRSIGRGGMSAVFDAQVWSDVDDAVKNSATVTLIGELGGALDIERLSKANNYRRDTRKILSQMDAPNSFLYQGREDIGSIRMWMPSHMHCEQKYDFFDMYKKHYPELMKTYSELIEHKKRELKEEENKYRERIKKREQQRKKEMEELDKREEQKTLTTQKIQKQITQAKNIVMKSKEEQSKIFHELHTGLNGKPMSYRQIAEQFNKSHNTVSQMIKKYEEKLKQTNDEQLKQPGASSSQDGTIKDDTNMPDM